MQNVSKALAATLKSTSVYFDLEVRTAIPITSKMKESAQKYLIKPSNLIYFGEFSTASAGNVRLLEMGPPKSNRSL